jgi:hypothetical protein
MTQDIIDKLHTALYTISPFAPDREQLIMQMGDTIWIESLEKVLLALPEEPRKEAIAALNEDNLEKAVELMEAHNIDVDAILAEVATSVMDDVIGVAGKEQN